jgi:APA family basic amino acid/polyamine antiporter
MLLQGLQAILYFYAYTQIPKKFPEAWKKSWLHIPNGAYYAVVLVAFLARMWIMIWSFRALNLRIAIVSTVVTLICFVYGFVRGKSPEINVSANVWTED